jgi:hypothetical protein
MDEIDGLDLIDEYFNTPVSLPEITKDANDTHTSNFFRETKWDDFIKKIGTKTLEEITDTNPTCEDYKILKFLQRSVATFLNDMNNKLITSVPEILRQQIMHNSDEKKKMFNPVSKAIPKYSKHIASILFIICRGMKSYENKVENFKELFPQKNKNILMAMEAIFETMRLLPMDSNRVVDIEELLYELFVEESDYDKSRNDFILIRAFAFSCYIGNTSSFCAPQYISQRLAALKYLGRAVIVKRISELSNTQDQERLRIFGFVSRQDNYPFTHVCSLKTLSSKYSTIPQKSNLRFGVNDRTGDVNYNEIVIGNGEKVSIMDFKNGFQNLDEKMQSDLEKLSSGFKMEKLTDRPIFDNIQSTAAGYSFLFDPVNNFKPKSKHLFRHLHPIFLKYGEIDKKNKFIQKWLKDCDKFEEYIALCLQLGGGSPFRASEIPSMLLSNCTELSQRGIFWHYGTLCTYQHYHKSRNVENMDRSLARFMEKGLATKILQYLVYIRPIQRYF